MNDIVTQARKTFTAVVYITQLVRMQDPVIRDLANVIISKKDPKTATIEENFGIKPVITDFVNWPEADSYYQEFGMSNLNKGKKSKKQRVES